MSTHAHEYEKNAGGGSPELRQGQWIDSIPLLIAFAATFARVWLAFVRSEFPEPGPCLALIACLFTGGLLIGDLRAWIHRRFASRDGGH